MSSPGRRPALDLIQFRDSGRHPQANRLGSTNNFPVYVYWWLSEAFHVRSGFPDCHLALMGRQDNVSEHGFLHPVSLALLFAEVAWRHLVSPEEYPVSTWHRPTFYGLLTGNPQLPAFSSGCFRRT